VSANVFACTVASHYHHVPRGAVVPWGQGPLLLAAAAMEERGSAGA
jgi:unsaturated rhamnogalacturonyl hydrolase